MLRRFRSLFRILVRRRDFEDGMTEELRFHIDQYTDDLARSGVSPEEASRRARIEFGGLITVKEDCREARALHLFDELLRQLSYASRLLRKTPGFTITALLTLAICIGANLTIFALLDSILLRPLPFPQANRLVTMFNSYPKAGVDRDGSSLTNYYERRGRIPAFDSLSIYRYGTAIVGERVSSEREQIMQVSPEFFKTLGVGPRLGRAFSESETSYQTSDVAILTDSYWRQQFGADPQIIGRRIRVDGSPATVVGVLPPTFHFLSSEARLYFPLASNPAQRLPGERHHGGNVIQMVARLKTGASLSQAQAQIDAQNSLLERDDPQGQEMYAKAGFRTIVLRLHTDHVAIIRPVLILIQAGALTLMLIGLVNLANLLLVRANSRGKELAVRRALGASSLHLVSEILVETGLLALLGGLLGVLVGAGGLRLLALLGTDRLPLGAFVAFDARVGFAALAVALLVGVVLASPIAWFNTRPNIGARLQAESRSGTAGRTAQRLRQTFIVAQIALAFVMVTGAGLLGLSLQRVMQVSPGFVPSHILIAQISLPLKGYRDGVARLAFTDRLIAKLDSLPGVLSAGVADNVPLSGASGKSAATVKGRVPQPGESPRGHYSYWVGGDYFHTLGYSLRAGRFLTTDDSRRSDRVCVVDEDFAHYYWPHSTALGQRLFEGSSQGPDAEAFTVVGVVGAVKQAGLTEEAAQGAIYYPYVFRGDNKLFVAIRTALPPEAFPLALARAVREVDPELAASDIQPMETRIADELVIRRSPTLLAGLFSAIAVLLTAIGTYGVLSFAVTQRRREIGVRMALGARPGQIRNQFLSVALRLLIAGALLGSLGAWLAGRAMGAILFHVPALDPAILASAGTIIAVAALAACLIPASRAARISPVQALNQE